MKDNTCNYSDTFQPYIGDYDKFEYDVKLTDGTIVENCYPNAGKFNSISDLHDGQQFECKLVSEIRFSQRPRYMLNDKVSEAKPDPEYLKRCAKDYADSKEKEKYSSGLEELDIYTNRVNRYLDTSRGEYWNNGLFSSINRQPQYIRPEPKINRNDTCPKCDSGKKYKKCCGKLKY